jgi:MFS superfamily sulfate permease-like transporter
LSALYKAFEYINIGAILITIISLSILLLWDKIPFLKNIKLIPGALVAVIAGILINEYFIFSGSSLVISAEHLVSLPVPQTLEDFKNIILFPDFNGFLDYKVWIVGATIAVVASIETLLCIEAADRMDAQKRFTDTNVELKAQGIGNILSALLGGLPMTSVVVRTSANNNAGAKSKMSAIFHGILLLISVLAIPFLLNKIPYATLAAVLLLVGYKLAKPSVIIHFWHKGKYQFIPFIATLLAVVFTDLLKGVALGMIISIIFILRGNMQRAYRFRKDKFEDGDVIRIDLAQEVSFLNKAAIKDTLNAIPENALVVINAQDTVYIAHDVLDLIHDFATIRAAEENIKVKLKGFKKAYELDDINDENNHVFFESFEEANIRKQAKKDYNQYIAVLEKSREDES